MATPPNLTEVEANYWNAGYLAGERDGKAVGYWEGYAEALKDAGIEDPPDNVEKMNAIKTGKTWPPIDSLFGGDIIDGEDS